MSDEKPQSPADESNEERGSAPEDLREDATDAQAAEQESLIERARARAAAGAPEADAAVTDEDGAADADSGDATPSDTSAADAGETVIEADADTDSEADADADTATDDDSPAHEALQDEAAADPLEAPADAGADAATPAVAAAPAAKGGGRGLALLSLVLALGAFGGAGYLYYELIHKQPYQARFDAVDERVDALVRSATEEGAAKTQALATELAQDLTGLRG
ncbi:MAG: hypothetical protein AAGI15_07445, partial [Pseudomonadota bacterium]